MNYTKGDNEQGDHAQLGRTGRESKERAQSTDDNDDSSASDTGCFGTIFGSEVASEYDLYEQDSAAEEHGKEMKGKKREMEKKKSAKTKSGKKSPQTKGPDAPKRPLSAFFMWLNDNRDQIQKDNPGLSITEISKVAGEMWHELKDKSKWERKAQKAKTEYKLAMAEYLKNRKPEIEGARAYTPDDDDDDDEDEEKSPRKSEGRKKSPQTKAPDAPQRPKSAFFMWLNDNRDQIQKDNPGLSITETAQVAGEIWQQLKDKSKWDKRAHKAMTEYELAVAEFLNKGK